MDTIVVRRIILDLHARVVRLTDDVDRLRADLEGGEVGGEVGDAIRLLIADKILKIENAVILVSHSVVDHTFGMADKI